MVYKRKHVNINWGQITYKIKPYKTKQKDYSLKKTQLSTQRNRENQSIKTIKNKDYSRVSEIKVGI